jgi:hypothetical protein
MYVWHSLHARIIFRGRELHNDFKISVSNSTSQWLEFGDYTNTPRQKNLFGWNRVLNLEIYIKFILNYYYRTKGYVRENMIYYSGNIECKYMGLPFDFIWRALTLLNVWMQITITILELNNCNITLHNTAHEFFLDVCYYNILYYLTYLLHGAESFLRS